MKQAVRTGEIAGTLFVNYNVVNVIIDRLFEYSAAHNLVFSAKEQDAIMGCAIVAVQIIWYNGRKLFEKYLAKK